MPISIPRTVGPSVEGKVTSSYQGPSGDSGPNVAAQELAASSKQLVQQGEELVHIDQVMKTKDAQVTALSDLNALKAFSLQQQEQARELTGVNAKGSAADMSEKFKQKRDEIAARQDPLTRSMFEPHADEVSMQHTDMLARNEYTKNEQHADDTAKATLDLNRQVAVTNGDLPSIMQARSQTLSLIDGIAERKGWDARQTQVMKINELTKIHKDVISNKVDTDPDWAQKYYDSVKGEIDADERHGIEKALEIGGLRKVAQDYAATVDVKGSTYEAEAAKARKEFHGAKQDAVIKELEQQFGEKHKTEEIAFDKAGDAAYSVYLKTNRFDTIPASIISAMKPKEAEALRHYAEERAKGIKDKTDFHVFHDLYAMAMEDPEKFINSNLEKAYPYLSDAHKGHFQALQFSMKNANDNKTAKGSKVKDLQTFNEQVDNYADRMGWPKGQAGEVIRGEFKALAVDTMMGRTKADGKPLTDKDRAEILSNTVRAVIKQDKPGWWKLGLGEVTNRLSTPEEVDQFKPSKNQIEAFRSSLPKGMNEQSDDSIATLIRLRIKNSLKRAQIGKPQ